MANYGKLVYVGGENAIRQQKYTAEETISVSRLFISLVILLMCIFDLWSLLQMHSVLKFVLRIPQNLLFIC